MKGGRRVAGRRCKLRPESQAGITFQKPMAISERWDFLPSASIPPASSPLFIFKAIQYFHFVHNNSLELS